MKRLALYLALVLPLVLLGLWTAFPQADPSLAAPLAHFYVVTFTTFAATVVSLFVTISVGETALPRHLLVAMSFAWMGAVFFIHGITTPGALIDHFHPGIVWSAWLTLFGGGAIFLVSAFTPNHPSPRFLRRAGLAILAAYAAYALLIFLVPGTFTRLLGLRISPAVGDLVFVVTLGTWLLASLRHLSNYRRNRHFVDGLMAFEAGWYAMATLSMFRFALWRASWWLYHVLLLAGFLIAIYALWRAYEQVRAFRLTRYYGATSLIVTAALALLSAQVYASFVFKNLRQQLETDSAAVSQHLGAELTRGLPAATAGALLDPAVAVSLDQRLDGLLRGLPAMSAAAVYAADGSPVYTPALPEGSQAGAATYDTDAFQRALGGLTTNLLFEPGASPDGYAPQAPVHVLETYVPLWPSGDPQAARPIGVVLTVREGPELSRALVTSRGLGLLLAALSLGGLFGALLVIVRRADQLITSRARELERAYAELRQAEALRDDLTHMIVHDLRGPLTALNANMDLIGRTLSGPALPEAPSRFLTSARAAGQRMSSMIDDLLNVAKFEAGELRPALAPVDLPALLRERLEAFRSQAEKEGKHVSVSVPSELPPVRADAGLIGRVVDNLMSNALKYTEDGGHVEIRADGSDGMVFVHVCDDGQGIPPEYHQRIFDKFVQVAASSAPLRKGTGLGLAFCRLAVEAHGGRIGVASALGQGSTFTFNLPLEG